jgi:hypothetical protein
MVQIGDKIISLDLFKVKFICDLKDCRGMCCVYGDSGAPLMENEKKEIKSNFKEYKKYLKRQGLESIKRKGYYYKDSEGDIVTTLIDNKECAYSIEEDGVVKCAIEKSWKNGESKFRKPLSCHLYPIRIKKYKDFTGINYDTWNICKAALDLGEKNDILLYKYLKEPLIRAFGDDWYKELEVVALEIEKSDILLRN